MLTAAYDKLQLRRDERTTEVERLSRMKLMHGGFELMSTVLVLVAAYLASVTAARHTAIFTPFCAQGHPLPSDTLLHGWLTDSMARMLQASPILDFAHMSLCSGCRAGMSGLDAPRCSW